jgi:cytochrome b6-f complex iron-sulfur subunit
MMIIMVVERVPHSLAYASGILVIVSLIGWVMEAREVAGPPPAVEPEHEEEEEAPGPSYWPLLLAAAIVGIAGGLIYDTRWGGFIVALPLAAGAAAGWANAIKREVEAAAPAQPQPYLRPIVASGGRVLLPVAPNVLAAQAAGGAAIAIERAPGREISRRGLLRISFWTGLGGFVAAMAACTVDMLYPRGVVGFGGVVSPGTTSQFLPGTKTEYAPGQLIMVHLTEEQAKRSHPEGKAGFLALWRKCPHLGCTVPWRETFTFEDRQGWFRCPCHGSTYDDAGARVFGPAPRSMDVMALTIDPSSGRINVNTGSIKKGTTENATLAVEG